jgi:hypothetical protein
MEYLIPMTDFVLEQEKRVREIEITKYKGFRFCKKSNFRENKKRLRRIAGQAKKKEYCPF